MCIFNDKNVHPKIVYKNGENECLAVEILLNMVNQYNWMMFYNLKKFKIYNGILKISTLILKKSIIECISNLDHRRTYKLLLNTWYVFIIIIS